MAAEAAEALASSSSAATEQNEGPDTQLNGNLPAQTEQKVDTDNKTDTGSNHKPAAGAMVNPNPSQQEPSHASSPPLAGTTAADGTHASPAALPEQDKGRGTADTQLDGASLDVRTADDKKADDTAGNYKPAAMGYKLDLKAVKEILWWVLLLVILALSIRQR